MLLAVDEVQFLIYEGLTSSTGRPVEPAPFLTQAFLSHAGQNPASGLGESPYVRDYKCLFREDMFDPVSRIRRGRFFKISATIPESWSVGPHPRIEAERSMVNRNGQIKKDLIAFDPLFISDDFGDFRTRPVTVALGLKNFPTLWRLVEIERISTGDELATLRAISTLGALPDLYPDQIPKQDRAGILGRYDSLASEVHRSSPESIIDHCRDLASAALFARGREIDPTIKAMDLGNLIKHFSTSKEFQDLENVISSAKIINRLHPRRKPSEQERRRVRTLHAQDGEFAVLALATILCDLGWATWT